MQESHFQTVNAPHTTGPSSITLILRTIANIITCKWQNQAPCGSEVNPKLYRTIGNAVKAWSWTLLRNRQWLVHWVSILQTRQRSVYWFWSPTYLALNLAVSLANLGTSGLTTPLNLHLSVLFSLISKMGITATSQTDREYIVCHISKILFVLLYFAAIDNTK